jgi:hypothetical protein
VDWIADAVLSPDDDAHEGISLRRILVMPVSPGEPGLVTMGTLSAAFVMGSKGVVGVSSGRWGSGWTMGEGLWDQGGM